MRDFDPRLYVLLDLNRWVLAGGVLVVVYAVVVATATVDPVPLSVVVDGSDPIETLFQALLTTVVTGVTLVVTVNQIVLSQELGALGDQYDRMESAAEFRRDLERVTDVPASPTDPSRFLAVLAEAAADRGDRLRDAVRDVEPATEDLERVAVPLRTEADAVAERLGGTEFGTFAVVRAALSFDYSRHLHAVRRLRGEYRADLPDAALVALDEADEALVLFGTAREHVKTLYFQWELIVLSRAVLYAAVPALAVTIVGILTLSGGETVTGAFLGVDTIVWVAGGGAMVALAPFAVLFSHILRIVTVTKRTLAIEPLSLHDDA